MIPINPYEIKYSGEPTIRWKFEVIGEYASELNFLHRYGKIPAVAVNRKVIPHLSRDSGFTGNKEGNLRYRFKDSQHVYTATSTSFFLEAEDLKTGEAVLIKVPHPANTPEAIERAILEATLVANLNQKGLVPRGIPKRVDLVGVYVEYEEREILLPGTVLSKAECNWDTFISANSSRDHSYETAKMVIDIGQALNYLHNFPESTGLIHADLKGENILRNDQGSYVLADFGSVQGKYRHGLPDNLTGAGDFTDGYSPFSIGQDRGVLDWREDLYALAETVETTANVNGLADLCKIAKDPNQTQFTNIMDFVNAVVDQIETGLTSMQVDFIENYRQDIYSPASSFNY